MAASSPGLSPAADPGSLPGPSPAYGADELLAHLSGARWFAGKGRRAHLVAVTPLPWLAPPSPGAPAVRSEVVEVAYAESAAPEFYQLAVSYRSEPQPALQHAEIGRGTDPELGWVVAYDATRDPDACRVFVDALLDCRQRREGTAAVEFHSSFLGGLTRDLEPRVYAGQQSNTSVMLGDVAILKLFRRLELGRNLDIEVHAALNRAGVADVARLYGWAEGSWAADGKERHADLAMVVELLAGARDGWAMALATLQGGSHFTTEAEALGRALATTHEALRASFPTGTTAGTEVAELMEQRVTAAAADASALQPYVPGIRACLEALRRQRLDTQRVHGDFHLGQTLHTPGGWRIIDFEGEPAKSLAERSAPDSVWRDVAGMLRSFDYAAASVPGPTSAAWANDSRAAFLGGYCAHRDRSGADGDAPGPVDTAILGAYEADKAVYEVLYEVRNRPDWVGIPLAAVARLARRALGHEQVKE